MSLQSRNLAGILSFMAAGAVCTPAIAQTAWNGPGTDATDPANWSAGVPILGSTIDLSTNGNTAYSVSTSGSPLLGATTNLTTETYTLSGGSTWGDAGHVFNATSGGLIINNVNVQGTLNLGIDAQVQGGTTIDAAISPTTSSRIDVRGDGAVTLNSVDLSGGFDLVIDLQGDQYTAGDNSQKIRLVPLNLGVLAGDGTDGNLTVQVRSPLAVQGNQEMVFGSAASGYTGDITLLRAVDSIATDTSITASLEATNATGTGELIVDNGAILTVGSLAGANQNGSLRVKSGGFIVVGDFGQPVFSGGSTLEVGAGVLIQADQPFTVSGSENVLIDNIQRYSSSLEVNSNTGGIGTAGRGLGGGGEITGQITGTATTVNFRGSGPNLAIDDFHVGDIRTAGSPVLVGARQVNIQRNMQFDIENTYTGGTTIDGDYRLRVNHENATGTGNLTFNGSSGNLALLEVNADGYTLGSGKIIVSQYGRMYVGSDVDANIEFAGGEITAVSGNSFTMNGSVTDAGNIQFGREVETFNGSGIFVPRDNGDLTFTGGVTMSGNRDWTVVEDMTVAFDGSVTGGSNTMTKLGAGKVSLNGAVSNLDLNIDEGTVARGASSTYSGSVSVADGAVYSVAQDHNYSEVGAAGLNGVIAIGADTTANLDFSSAGSTARLGAENGTHTYSGTLTPQGSTYRLGGGSGTLVMSSVLSGSNGIDIADGDVILTAANTASGAVTISSYAGVTDPLAFQNASSVTVNGNTETIGTSVKPLAALDLNNTGISVGSITWNGGGISNSGGNLTAGNLATAFGSNYVLGGPGTGNTTVDAGALATGTVKKVGSNTVTLASGANAFTGALTVFDGKVIVNDAASIGSHGNVILEGGDVDLNDDATWTVTGGPSPVTLKGFLAGRDGKLSVAADKTLTIVNNGTAVNFNFPYDLFVGGFLAQDRRGTLTIGGEGTVEHAGTNNVIWAAHLEAQLILEDSVTFHTNWGTALGKANLFVVKDNATLKLKGLASEDIGIGYFEPGTTLEIDAGTDVEYTAGDATGMHFIGSGSSIANPHRIGGEGNFRSFTNSVSGTFRSSDEAGNPIAYVEKFGSGTVNKARSQESFSGDWAGKYFWIVEEGTLKSDEQYVGSTGLGATAFYEDRPNFYKRHLEGMIVRDGATLQWRGSQGFFDNSTWIAALPEQDGDGWLPGEFVLEGGATLKSIGSSSSVGSLVLGLVNDGNTYLAYPTIGDSSANGNDITFYGNINFRSGIEVSGDVAGGLLDVVVQGEVPKDVLSSVHFSNNLTGAIGVDVFQTLDVQSGSAVIYQNHANVTSTTVASGAILEFAPTGSISYSGSVASDGEVQVSSGTAAVEQITGTGTLTIDTGATLQLTGDTVGLSTASSATLDGTLDIDQSGIVLGGTDEATVQSQIVGGTIISTTAASVSTHAIGYGPSGSDTLIRYALTGDANLDNSVNIGDLTLLAGSFGGSGFWANGDFNHDGLVNIGDLTLLAGNFGDTFSATAVPEPTSLALLALGGLALIRRR